MPAALLRVATDNSTDRAVKPRTGGRTEAQASTTRSSASAGDSMMPDRLISGWTPMTSNPAATLLTARQVTGDQGEAERRQHLSAKHLGAAAGAGQHGRPRAVAILGREQVAAHHARQRGKDPQCGKPQDHERYREPRILDGPAEQRVLGEGALYRHRGGEDERAGHAHHQRDAVLSAGRSAWNTPRQPP